MKKYFIQLLLVFGLVGFTAACSLQRTESNEWGCSFGKGPLDSFELKNTIAPGGNAGLSNDTLKTLPADVRTYVLDEDPAVADYKAVPLDLNAQGRDLNLALDAGSAEEAAAVERLAQSAGIVPVSVELQARFVINEKGCDLYVNHLDSFDDGEYGLNFNAGQGEQSGWAEFLNLSWNQKMVEAARPVVFEFDWLVLNTNGVVTIDGDRGNIFELLNDRISENLSRELEKDLGDNYFCGPSYTFDGDADGELTAGCPPIEVTVKEIRPTGAKGEQLMADYAQIVANAEAAQRVLSDKDLQITELNAQRDAELATEENRLQTELAKAQNDEKIAEAQQEARLAEAQLVEIRQQAEAAKCIALAEVGIRCDLLEAAENGAYPRIVIGDSDDANLLIDVGQGG